jgi:AmmeMemoRadiSam system protein B
MNEQLPTRKILKKSLAQCSDDVQMRFKRMNISMCGVISTTVTLVASLALGASSVELIRYATSGDVTGDYVQVVGYASFIVE